MAEIEKVILTNMCMVTDEKGNMLVQNRADPNWPGLVFPGGHVEPGESFVKSVIREVWEETGITIIEPRLCGVKQFMTMDNVRYIVFLFKAEKYEGELRSSDEGEALWVPIEKRKEYEWVRDFEDMWKMFLDDEVSEIRYFRENGKLLHEYC